MTVKDFFNTMLVVIFPVGLMCTSPTDTKNETVEQKPQISVENYSIQKYEYVYNNNSISLFVPQCNCIDDSLHLNDYVKSYNSVIKNDTLTISFNPITLKKSNSRYSYSYRLHKIYGKEMYGIKGIWKLDSILVSPMEISNNLGDNDLSELYKLLKSTAFEYIDATVQGHLTILLPLLEPLSFYRQVINYINSAKEDQFYLQYDSLSPDYLQIIGHHSGDTVFISKNGSGDSYFRSSNKDTVKYYFFRHFAIPDTCPNPIAPTWFRTLFLDSNKTEYGRRIEYLYNYFIDWQNTLGSSYSVTLSKINNDSMLISGNISPDSVFIYQDKKGRVYYQLNKNPDNIFSYFPKYPSEVIYPSWFRNNFLEFNKKPI